MAKKTFSNSIANFIKSIDYFAVTFEFRVDKKKRYGSVTGGTSYILYLIFALIFFAKSFSDYISFTETKITYIDKATEPSPALNYQKLNFSYAIQITFENDTALQNTSLAELFNIQHSFVFYNKTEKIKNKVNSPPRNCKQEDFHGMTDKFPIFKRNQVSDFLCFDFHPNFTLQGIYTDDYMSYAEILLELNENYLKNNFNRTANKDRKLNSNQELRKIFNNNLFKFTLFYLDTYSDINDKENPLFYKLDSTYTYLDLDYFRRYNVFFQQFNYSQDNNLFYKNYENYSSMKLFTIQNVDLPIDDRFESKLEEKNFLSKFVIRSINNQKLIKVSYVKIPEFLASLSGLLLNTLLILNYVMFLFNNLEAKQKIINKIMKYKDIIKTNNKKTLDYITKKFDDDNFRLRRLSRLSHINENNNTNKTDNNPFVKKYSQKIESSADLGIDKEFDCDKHFSKSFILESIFTNIKSNDNNTGQSKNLKIDNEIKETNLVINCTDSINSNEGLKQKLNPFYNSDLERENTKESKASESKQNNKTENKILETNYDLNSSNINNNKSSNQRNPYEIHPTDIISRLFCCRFFKRSKKHIIFENAEKKFDHNLDMVTYMKKMQELDIIKYLLLDKNTLQLVNFISKPCISMSSKSIEDPEYKLFFEIKEDGNSVSYQNIDVVKKCYDTILAKKDKTSVESRILQLFDLQIEEIIN